MPSILITGANRGLGFEFARQYASDGWQVFAACRSPQLATSLTDLARSTSITILQMDVTDTVSVQRSATHIGTTAIDILLNNAGIIGAAHQTIGHMDYDSWAEVLNVNTMGPFRVTEAFVDHVARSKRKLVVTITSRMGSVADNASGGSVAYRSSKAAVNMVMRTLAIELAPRGISCVLVSPGWVKTEMGGSGATLTPVESVTALRRLIETLGPSHSGRFYSYDGRECRW